MADLGVQVGHYLAPVELKTGKWSEAVQILHCSRIRPAQIRLLDEALAAGINARLIIGERWLDGSWSAWMLRNVRAQRLRTWRKGFARTELTLVARGDELLLGVGEW